MASRVWRWSRHGRPRRPVEEGRNGVMVSLSGQLNLHYVDFETLVDPQTLITVVRYIPVGSDFHKLARFLGDAVILPVDGIDGAVVRCALGAVSVAPDQVTRDHADGNGTEYHVLDGESLPEMG
jgi:hypothetical protein